MQLQVPLAGTWSSSQVALCYGLDTSASRYRCGLDCHQRDVCKLYERQCAAHETTNLLSRRMTGRSLLTSPVAETDVIEEYAILLGWVGAVRSQPIVIHSVCVSSVMGHEGNAYWGVPASVLSIGVRKSPGPLGSSTVPLGAVATELPSGLIFTLVPVG